jgi:hypothetical protein
LTSEHPDEREDIEESAVEESGIEETGIEEPGMEEPGMEEEVNGEEEPTENIIPINIEDEMKTSYIDYSMSVIVGRALPDVRDGPRILICDIPWPTGRGTSAQLTVMPLLPCVIPKCVWTASLKRCWPISTRIQWTLCPTMTAA